MTAVDHLAGGAATGTLDGHHVGPVAHVAAFYPPYVGGVEKVAQQVSRELATQNVSVSVLTTTAGARRSPRRETVDGVDVRRHRSVRVAGSPVSLGLFLDLLRLRRDTLVHVHVAHAALTEMVRLACRLRGLHYVVHFHLDVEPSGRFGRLLPAYKRWSLGPAIRSADRVIALTPEMGALLAARYGVAPDRIGVVGNGITAGFFAAGLDAPRTHDGPLRLLFVGRLVPQKNVERLLAAVALLDVPAEVTVVGDGIRRGSLQALARDLDLTAVTFVGEQDEDAVAGWMRWADLLVCTSDNEGAPLVVLEAMAAGLPVVSTDVPGMRGLVGDAGTIVAADPAAVGAAIVELAGRPERRQAMAAAGRARTADKSWAEIGRAIRSQYAQIVEAR